MVSATATLFSYNFTDHHILSPFPTIPKSFIGLCKPFHSRLPTSIHLHFTPSSFIVRAVIKWRCPKQIHPPNCDRGFQKKVLYLESIGIDSFSLIENHPMLISASLSDIKSTVEYMTSMDFTAIEFRRIVGMCPEILTTKLSDVIPVFTFLLREAHVKGSDIKHAINRRPRLLVCSVDKQLRPTLYFLQSIGIEEGCDASILLDDSNDDKNRSAEKQAIPNQTLRGFDKIDMIKEELEQACPGVVSCADILALATRDAVLLAGGPFYPVLTGRKDSHRSFFEEATNQIPRPDDNVTRTLHLFGLKGFNERETVSLLGGHNIGKIGCDFIHPRLYNFMGTGQPDPSIPHDFLLQMWLNCPNNITTTTDEFPDFVVSKRMSSHSDLGMSYMQALSASVSSGAAFDTHYYQSLLRGRGLLFADQQLMAAEKTARLVSAYSSDDGSTFRTDFARVMLKMSNLDVLSGLQGQVRLNCSQPVSS